MPKLLGFLVLLSLLTLGGTHFLATPTQAQEPVKMPDFGDKIELDNSKKWDPNSQEWHNRTYPSDENYPFYANITKSDKVMLVIADTKMPIKMKSFSWWNPTIFLDTNFYSKYPAYDDASAAADDNHVYYVSGFANNHLNMVNFGYAYYGDSYIGEGQTATGFQMIKEFAENNPSKVIILNESFTDGMCNTNLPKNNPDSVTNPEFTNSWGYYDEVKLHKANLSNVIFVISAGNYRNKTNWDYKNAVNCNSIFSKKGIEFSISALNKAENGLADFSNWRNTDPYNGTPIHAFAVPGEYLPMFAPDGTPTNASGTSFSTPQVSALISTMFQLLYFLNPNATMPNHQEIADILHKTADVVVDKNVLVDGQNPVLDVINGIDALLYSEAKFRNQPVCHSKISTLVQGSNFELGCGFNSGISQPTIPGYEVKQLSQKNGVVAKYLVSCPTSSTCPTAGSYSVMLNGVSAGSLQILSPEVARNQMVETSQMVSINGKDFAYNLVATNPVSLYVKLTITNATEITQIVSYDLAKFWGNCTGKDGKFDIIGTVAKVVNCTDNRLGGMSDQNVISPSNPQFFDTNYMSGSLISLAPGSVKVLVFQLQKFDVSKGLQIPCFTFENTFSPFCTPSIISGATQPTATPTIPASTPTATATPIPGQPTATLPVKTPTPTATATPIAAKRVYLPMVVKRK